MIAKGWNFVLVTGYPVTSDLRISSIQAKYVKFLQFLNDFPEFKSAKRIIYFDMKNFFKKPDIQWILKRHNPAKQMFVLLHDVLDRTIRGEINMAINQPRYAEKMKETEDWLEKMISQRGISENGRVDSTGVISYIEPETIMPLLDEIYNTILMLGQPECQIIWSALSQLYSEKIQHVEWDELNILQIR